jgi:rubrerythrin
MGVLTAKQEKLLALFKNAIDREKHAQKAYKEMLPLNDDPAIKRIIETFIKQEEQHEKTLLKLYNELRTIGEFKDAT